MEPLRPGDPRKVGRYLLQGRLGGGGMGQVYLGCSPGGRPVAVKVMRWELAEDAGFRRRFAREVRAARRVGGFYTAQLVDADPRADPPWLATAFVPGPSLEQAVGQHGPLPQRALGVLGAGLAEGLAAIHGEDLVHRDLKPGNIILAADGPRVIDFGVAVELDAAGASTLVLGTPGYMSPEQARGLTVGAASDVFALGAVLTFAATGHGPFGSGQAEAVIYRIVHDDPDLTGLPAHLTGLVSECLDKDAGRRPLLSEVIDRLRAPRIVTSTWLPSAITAMITTVAGSAPTTPRRCGRSGHPVADKILQQTDASGKVTTAVFRRQSPTREAHFTDFEVGVDPDMVVIGGGATGVEEPWGALLTASYPNSARTGWLASSKDHESPSPHRLVGFSIGLKIEGLSRDQLLANLSFTWRTSDPAAHPAGSACVPAGFTLISGGFRVNWQPGAGNLATASFPEHEDVWTARAKDHLFPSPGTIDSFSIGLRTQLPDIGRVERGVSSNISRLAAHPSVSETLVSGFVLTGIGAEVRFTGPGSLLWRLEPTVNGNQQGVTAGAKDHEIPSPATIEAWALGIRLASDQSRNI